MKNNLVGVPLIVSLILLFVLFPVEAQEILEYKLTNEKIEIYQLQKFSENIFMVTLELKKNDKEEFARLTGENIGKKLELIYSGQVLLSAKIQGRIDSGRIIVRKFASESEAMKFMKDLGWN